MSLTAPPGLLAAALLLWGWRGGHLWAALLLAVAVEAHRLARLRWDLEDGDFNRIADLSTVAFALLAVYQFTEQTVRAVYAILGWMPVLVGPLLLAQLYSAAGSVPAGALFASLRRRAPPAGGGRRFDLTYPYVLLCLVAATPGTEQRGPFLLACALVLAWALAPLRPRRQPLVLWAGALLALAAGALLLGGGVLRAQSALERGLGSWIAEHWWSSRSPDATSTAIGSLGRLKLSERIEVRARLAEPLRAPLLLREATYASYHFGTWRSDGSAFQLLDPDPARMTWPLGPPAPHEAGRATITTRLAGDSGLVPVPVGAYALRGALLTAVQRNALDSLRIDARPGYVSVEVEFGAGPPPAPEPDTRLLEVPAAYRERLRELAGEAAGAAADPPARVAALERWFAAGFRYSLYQPRGAFGGSLLRFLTDERAGHCEYFATATVLMLRSLGVPARYAVGYALSEWSALERAYLGRARDRHAWAEAWVDGRWQVVDTTPALWLELERDATGGLFTPLTDLAAWVRYRWAEHGLAERLRAALPWAVLPLGALLLWRLRGRARAALPAAGRASGRRHAGDPAVGALLEALERAGWPAGPGETLRAWLARAGAGITGLRPRQAELEQLVALHYRLRFDPRGLPPAQRERLDRLARALAMTLARGPGD